MPALRWPADLLKSLPSLKVLVSSREPLGVTGEAVFRVPSLSFPQDEKPLTLDHVQEFEAVCLFQERARAALPDFQLNERNAAFVAQICRRLDGIPLAIELAASRVASLDVEHIASRLDQAFRLLSGGSRGALERHRTLRAAVDWSYNLLTVQERMLLRRLSVFVGGCTIEAAELVCSREGIEQDEILDLLSRLVDKSMLVVEQSPAGEVRYRLLETLRQYAEEKQDGPLEIERLRQMHCDWFVQFAERAGLKMSMGEDRIWHKKLDADVDNLRAALGWSIDQRADPQAGMRIINALVHEFWKFFPYASEAEQWAEQGMAQLSAQASIEPLLQVRSLASLNEFNLGHNHPPDMQRFEQIVALCLKLGDKGALIHANLLWYDGFVLALKTGDLQTGLEMLKQSEAMLRSIIGRPAKLDLSTCLVGLTWVSAQLGDLQAALAYAQESSDITHEMGSMRADIDQSLGDVHYWLGNYAASEKIFQKAILADPESEDFYRKLGDVYRAQRKYDQAISKYREALPWTIEFSHWHNVVWLQCCFAFTAVGQARDLAPKQPEEAAPLLLRATRIFGSLQPVMTETGEILPVEYQAEYDRDLEILRERLDPTDFEDAWAEGRAMNRKQVVAYLLEDGDHPEWEID